MVVFGLADDDRVPILALGEAKWGETMGVGHLTRLRHIRGLLAAQGRHSAQNAKLLCYSGAGFTSDLRAEAEKSPEVGLDRAGVALFVSSFDRCAAEATGK